MSALHKFLKPRGGAIFATICAAALALPILADPVQINPGDYSCSFAVKFSGYRCASTLTNFPVLVRLSKTLNDFDYSKCAANGADLRFCDPATGELLPHEIDTWNATGTSLVWVKVKSLSRTTVVRACYGYKGEGEPPAVSVSDVWDSDYVGVWHLGEAAAPLKESTSVSTAFDTPIGTPRYAQDGAIGGAVNVMDGCLTAPDDPDLDGFADITIELWSKKLENSNSNNRGLLSKRAAWDRDVAYMVYDYPAVNEADRGRGFGVCTNGNGVGGATAYGTKSDYPALNIWAYQAYSRTAGVSFDMWNAGTKVLHNTWLNGLGTEPIYNSSAPLALGANAAGGGDRFPGLLDELRISKSVRSADWIKTSYDCVTDDGFAVYELSESENDWKMYSHKFAVSFENAFSDETTLQDFPVLVKISEENVSGFDYDDCLRPNGGDLRFADADGNPLASEVDVWNENGTSLVWVKVPSLSASTKITAYYGRASLCPSSKPSEVWDAGYKAVYHMNGSIINVPDSTSAGGDLQYWRSGGFTSSKVNVAFADGIVGTATEFGIYSDKIGCLATISPSCLVTNEAACTVETWFIQDDHDPADATGKYFIREVLNNSTTIYTQYELNDPKYPEQNGQIGTFVKGTTASCWMNGYSGSLPAPTRAEWHYQVTRYDSADGKYANILDCSKMKSGTYNVGPIYCDASTSDYLYVGASQSSAGAWPGKIDEVRISKVVRSDAWLKATYDTIKNADFATYGEAVQNTKGFVIIVR